MILFFLMGNLTLCFYGQIEKHMRRFVSGRGAECDSSALGCSKFRQEALVTDIAHFSTVTPMLYVRTERINVHCQATMLKLKYE